MAVRNGASLNYLLNDHLGSTSVILKTNGALWGELRYSAWDETRYSNGTIVTDRQYTGQVNDGDTGLYYYNARYYDPALHRFIQADTIVPNPNDPQTLNRFSYTNNNPVKYTDPTGHYVENDGGTNCVSTDNCGNADAVLSEQGAAAVDATLAAAPVIYDTSVTAIRMVCELCDMAATAYSWTQGDFHPADLAGFGTPFVNSITARTGAGIIADGAEALARNGDSVNSLLPRGNLTIQPNPAGYSASELRGADVMATAGHDVILRPPTGTRAQGGTSDLLVDGVNYDVYTPRTSNPNRIVGAAAHKNTQATGLIVDLSETSLTPNQMGNLLARIRGAGATNIIDVVTIKAGTVP